MRAKKVLLCAGPVLLLAMGAGGQSNPALNQGETQFLNKAARLNMIEAHLGQMALDRGASQAVRDFGQTVAQDFRNANQELSSLANRTRTSIPGGIDTSQEGEVETLTHLPGESFDQHFLQQQTQAHQKAIGEYKAAAGGAQNSGVKNYANKMVSMLEGHLQRAQDLSKPGALTAAASSPVAAGTANREMGGEPASANTVVTYGTVTNYVPGRDIQIKERGRAGTHDYNIGALSAEVPAGIANGSKVVVTERVDENGKWSVTIAPDTGSQ